MRRRPWSAVHFHEAPEAIQNIVESAGGQLVYQSHETAPIVISKRFHPANTNPLVFKRTALFRSEDQQGAEAAMQSGVLNQLKEAGGEASVQVYQRVRRKDAWPAAFGRMLG